MYERIKAFVGRYLVEYREIFGGHRAARDTPHDWVCSCQKFQHQLKYEPGAYCRHIEAVMPFQGDDAPPGEDPESDIRIVHRSLV